MSPASGSPTSRYLAQAFLLAGLVTAAAAWPAWAWAQGPGLAALGAAGGICLLGAVAARAAAKAIAGLNPGPEAGPQAVQAGIAVRLLATLAMTVPVLVWKPVPAAPFAAWLGLHYLGQLGLEVFVSLRELGQNHDPTGTPARASQPEAAPPPTGSLEKQQRPR